MPNTITLTVLGSGTCFPNGERNSAGYFVDTGDARVMFDCGAGAVHALARFKLPWETLSHVFLSHFHVDHIGELAPLMFAFRHGMKTKRTSPLTLIGPRGLERVIHGLEAAFGSRLFKPDFPLETKIMEPEDVMAIGPHTSLAVAKTPHTDESLAVRVETRARSLCYTGDTEYSAGLADFFQNTNLLLSECSFQTARNGARHLSVKEAALLAAQSRATRLLLTHFYFEVNEPELKAEVGQHYKGDVLVARDGLEVSI